MVTWAAAGAAGPAGAAVAGAEGSRATRAVAANRAARRSIKCSKGVGDRGVPGPSPERRARARSTYRRDRAALPVDTLRHSNVGGAHVRTPAHTTAHPRRTAGRGDHPAGLSVPAGRIAA
ncbi:hypothetical protein GCM10010286_57540 [Streptomyces toxytricini]|nr:hypothetical protein GCM10010286_57540 [Streptomyces toxytricini]